MPVDPTRGQTPTDPLAAVILATIEAEPHHRRLYPDLYASEIAAAVRQHLAARPEAAHPETAQPETAGDGEHRWLHVARDVDGRIFSVKDDGPLAHLDEDDVVTQQGVWIPAIGVTGGR